MYLEYVPDLVAEKYNITSFYNSYYALKKVQPSLTGGKKRGGKPGSNIKYYNTQED